MQLDLNRQEFGARAHEQVDFLRARGPPKIELSLLICNSTADLSAYGVSPAQDGVFSFVTSRATMALPPLRGGEDAEARSAACQTHATAPLQGGGPRTR